MAEVDLDSSAADQRSVSSERFSSKTMWKTGRQERNSGSRRTFPSSAYSQYITTPEEYAMRHYGGVPTLFEPHTRDACIPEFRRPVPAGQAARSPYAAR